MNQNQPAQQEPTQPPTQEVGLVESRTAPSHDQSWARPEAGRSWNRLPTINQALFAASFGCLGLGGLSLVGPPLAETARQAYHPYTSEGRRETCLSNLQAISQAISLYTQDTEGRLPLVERKNGNSSTTWIASLSPHISDPKLWACPLAPSPASRSASYALNPVLAGKPLSSADDPAATLLLGDGSTPGALAFQPPYPGWNDGANSSPSEAAGLAFRHEGAAGIVYADGHSATLDPGGVNEAALWGGSAAARASLERIGGRNARTRSLVTALQRGDGAKAARLLRASTPDVTAASRDLLALWELNARNSADESSGPEAATTTSQSVDALGWNLAWAWHRLGQDAALQKLESHVGVQAGAELERVKADGLQSRADPGGGTFDAPQGWTDEETAKGNYRTLTLRSQVPGLFLYIEVGTRSSLAASPIPVDWRRAEARLKAKYGSGYRRLSLSRGTLSGYPAGVWEYELDKPGSPRLRKRLIGMVNGWNSTVFATTAPKGSFDAWKATFERVAGSF